MSDALRKLRLGHYYKVASNLSVTRLKDDNDTQSLEVMQRRDGKYHALYLDAAEMDALARFWLRKRLAESEASE